MAKDSVYSEDFGAQVSFHAFSIGGGPREDGVDTGWRSLPASLLELPIGGAWELWLEGLKSPLMIEDGEALVVPAGVRHRLRSRGAGRMETRFLLGSFLWLSQLDLVSSAGIPPHLTKVEGGALAPPLDEMLELWNAGRHSVAVAVRLHELAFKLLGVLLTSAKGKSISLGDSRFERLANVLSVMNASPEATLSCRSLARKAGLSPSRFNAVFREALGVAPKVYLGNLRIRKASSLLISSDRTVYDIANECGFNSSCYFCRFFAKSTGMSPSAFREAFRRKIS